MFNFGQLFKKPQTIVSNGFSSILKQNKGTTGLHWKVVNGHRIYTGMTPQQAALYRASFNRGVNIEHGRITGEGGGSNSHHLEAHQNALTHTSRDTADQISSDGITQGRLAFRAFHKENPHAADGMSRNEMLSAVNDHVAETSNTPATPHVTPPVAPPAAPPAAPPRAATSSMTPAQIAAKTKQLHNDYIDHRLDGIKRNLEAGINLPTSAMASAPTATAKLQALNDHIKASGGSELDANVAISAAAHEAHQKGIALVNTYNQNKAKSLHDQYVNNHLGKVHDDLSSGGNGAILQVSDMHDAGLKKLHDHVKATTGSTELADQATTRAKDAAHDGATALVNRITAERAAHEATNGLAPESSVRDAVNGMSHAQQHNYLVEHEARTAANPPTARHTQLYEAIRDRHAKEAAHKAAHDKLVQDHVDGILAKHSVGANHIDTTDMAHIPRIGMRVNQVGDAAVAAGKDAGDARRAVVREAKEKAHAALAHARVTTQVAATPSNPTPAVPTTSTNTDPHLNANAYTNTTDGHNKFWKVSVQGKYSVVHYGAIGSRGVIKVKDHGSVAAARAAVMVLTIAKRRDGYVSTGASTIDRAAAHSKGLPQEAVVSTIAASTAATTTPSQAPVLPSQQREATAARFDALLNNVHQTARALGAVHDPNALQDHPDLASARQSNNDAQSAAQYAGVSPVRILDAHNDGYAAGRSQQGIQPVQSEADRLVAANRAHAEAMTTAHNAQQSQASQPPVTTTINTPVSVDTIAPTHHALNDYDYRALQSKSQVAKHLHDAAFSLKNIIRRYNNEASEVNRNWVAKAKGILEAYKLYAHNNTHIISARDAGKAILSGTKATRYSDSPIGRRLNRGTTPPRQVRNPTIENSAAATPEALRPVATTTPAVHTPNRGAPNSELEKLENDLRVAVHQRGRNMAQYEHDRQAPPSYLALRNKIDDLINKVTRLSDSSHAKALEKEGLAKGNAERKAELALEKLHGQKIATLTAASHALGKNEGYAGGMARTSTSPAKAAELQTAHANAFAAVKEAVGEAKAKELHEAAHARGIAEGKALHEQERQARIGSLSDAIAATAREQGRLSATGQTLPLSTLAAHATKRAELSALTNEAKVANLHDDSHAEGLAAGQKVLTDALTKAAKVIGFHDGKNTSPSHEDRLAVETAHAAVKTHISLKKANEIAAKAHAEGKADALNPDMTKEKVEKHMKELGLERFITPDFGAKWAQHMPKISPTEFMHAFFGESDTNKTNLSKLGTFEFGYGGFSMKANNIQLHGSKANSIHRSFEFTRKVVEHSYLSIATADQSKGGVRKMFNALMGKGADGKCAYERMGMDKAHVHGALDGGGYTWPSFGFYYDNPRQQEYHLDQIQRNYSSRIANSVKEPLNFSKVKSYVDSNNTRLPNPDGTFAVRPFTEADHAQYLTEHKVLSKLLENRSNLATGYLITKMNTPMLNAVHSNAISAAMGEEKRPTLAKLLMRGTDMNGTITFKDDAQMTPIRENLKRA